MIIFSQAVISFVFSFCLDNLNYKYFPRMLQLPLCFQIKESLQPQPWQAVAQRLSSISVCRGKKIGPYPLQKEKDSCRLQRVLYFVSKTLLIGMETFFKGGILFCRDFVGNLQQCCRGLDTFIVILPVIILSQTNET